MKKKKEKKKELIQYIYCAHDKLQQNAFRAIDERHTAMPKNMCITIYNRVRALNSGIAFAQKKKKIVALPTTIHTINYSTKSKIKSNSKLAYEIDIYHPRQAQK